MPTETEQIFTYHKCLSRLSECSFSILTLDLVLAIVHWLRTVVKKEALLKKLVNIRLTRREKEKIVVFVSIQCSGVVVDGSGVQIRNVCLSRTGK